MNETRRIESKEEVQAYLQNLRYVLDHGATVDFQESRMVDQKREVCYTNQYTVQKLFSADEVLTDALKRELRSLTVEMYMGTVKDLRFPRRSEMREFGKVYSGNREVYIKIRVELMKNYGNHYIFVMSFHFAEREFTASMFPFAQG